MAFYTIEESRTSSYRDNSQYAFSNFQNQCHQSSQFQPSFLLQTLFFYILNSKLHFDASCCRIHGTTPTYNNIKIDSEYAEIKESRNHIQNT